MAYSSMVICSDLYSAWGTDPYYKRSPFVGQAYGYVVRFFMGIWRTDIRISLAVPWCGSRGLCAAFGTIIPVIAAGQNLFSTRAGILTLIGVSIAVAGIAIIGYAGSLKSREMTEEAKRASVKEFALKKGILIAIFSGIMSACFNFGFEAGKPIENIAVEHGANPLFQKNPTLIFILFGGFLTNLVYCGYLNIRNKTYTDYFSSSGNVLLNNLLFTFLAGFLWFLQFHFYGMGSSKLPEGMAVFGWSILMALNIAISNIWGIILKEWKGVRKKTIIYLIAGIIVLILSTFVVKLS